jgi:hypothetical protein
MEESLAGSVGEGNGGRRGLPAGGPVDQLAEDVGVPGMTGGLLQQVHQDPAEVDRSLVTGLPAGPIEVEAATTAST